MSATVAPDHLSPFLSQRQIELENVGSIEVPAFGVCEVTDVYLPESASSMSADGGPIVYKVRRPTTDSPCHVIINGPCPIPPVAQSPDNRGKPGTNDYPTYALYSAAGSGSAGPSAGDEYGAKADSFELNPGYTGFVILGAADGTKVQVMRGCGGGEMLYVRPNTCMKPGDSVTATVAEWDGGWSDSTRTITVVNTDCLAIALTTERLWVKVVEDGTAVPINEYKRSRWYYVPAGIDPYGSGDIEPIISDSCGFDTLTCSGLTGCNPGCEVIIAGYYLGVLSGCDIVIDPGSRMCLTGTGTTGTGSTGTGTTGTGTDTTCPGTSQRVITGWSFDQANCEAVITSKLLTQDTDGCITFTSTQVSRASICCDCTPPTGTGTYTGTGCAVLYVYGSDVDGVDGCYPADGDCYTKGSYTICCSGNRWYLYYGEGENDYYRSPVGDCTDCPPEGVWENQSTGSDINVTYADECFTGTGTGSCWDSTFFTLTDAGGGDVNVQWDADCCDYCGSVTVKIYRDDVLIHTASPRNCNEISGSDFYLDSPGAGSYTYRADFITDGCGTTSKTDSITI